MVASASSGARDLRRQTSRPWISRSPEDVIEVRSAPKLLYKLLFVMVTITVITLACGVGLQALIALKPEHSRAEVGAVLWPIVWVLTVVGWIIAVPIMALWVRNLSYIVGDERISIHKGLLSRIQQNIPYRAITDFQLHRSPFDRLLGIGSLRIQTAGQGQTATGYEGNLAGLVDWEDLLERLRSKVQQYQAAPGAYSSSVNINQVELSDILNELRAIRTAIEERS